MRLGLVEGLPEPGLVGRQHVLDLVHDHAFAARSALVQAEVLVGVELALPMKDADFGAAMEHDAAVAFGEIGNFFNKDFRHFALYPHRWLPCRRASSRFEIGSPASAATAYHFMAAARSGFVPIPYS